MYKLQKFAFSKTNLIKGGAIKDVQEEFDLWKKSLSADDIKTIEIKMNFIPNALYVYFVTYVYTGQ